MKKIKSRFICSERGKKRGVLLDLKDFEILIDGLEDYHDYRIIKEFEKDKNPKFFTLQEVERDLFGKK